MTRRTAMILAAWAHGLLMSVLATGCANHATQVQIRNDTQLTLDVAVLGRETLGSGYQEHRMLEVDPHTGERSVRNTSLAMAPGATHTFNDASNAPTRWDGPTTALVMVSQAGIGPWMAWSVQEPNGPDDGSRLDAELSIAFGPTGYVIQSTDKARRLEVRAINQAAGTDLSRAIRDWQTHLDAWRFAHAK
jgi:hypothetical protein